MLVIRFARRGRKGRPFYDLVVAEKSRPVKKKFIEQLGYYNPLSSGGKGELVFDKSLLEKYIKNGAQVSQSVARLLVKEGFALAGKFVKARHTVPKKEPKPEPVEEKEIPKPEEVIEEASEAPQESDSQPTEKTEEPPAENKIEEDNAPEKDAPAEKEDPADDTEAETPTDKEVTKEEEKTA